MTACIHSAIAPNMNRCIVCGNVWTGEQWEAPASHAQFWRSYEWTHAGVVHIEDDSRYVADEFGELILVPFCGRREEFQEH